MKLSVWYKNDGFAVVYGIVLLLVASIAGVSLITISQKDNIASIDQVKMRAAALSAEAALTAVEQQCEKQPEVIVEILNSYINEQNNTSGKGWLLSTADKWTQENKISLDPDVPNTPQYSARILSYDSTSGVLQVEGYGYGGGGGKKKAIGIYQLSGLAQSAPFDRHAFYMIGEAQSFDKPVNISGNVYFAGKVASNGTTPSVINGTFQAMSTTETVLFQSSFTFNGNALFMGPTTLQGVMYFNQKAGFNKTVTLNAGPQQAKEDLYFNNLISGNDVTKVFNLNGNKAHTTTTYPVSAARVTNGTIVKDGAAIDVAAAVSLSPTIKDPFQFDISVIPASYIKTVSGNIDAAKINALSKSSTLWKGYLVIKPAAYAAVQRSSNASTSTLTCNTIWIIEKMMFSNDGWYDCAPNTMTILYFRSTGQLNGLGSGGYFRGYIHATENYNITYAWKAGNNFIGAVHHVSKTGKFQMNSCTGVWNITWSDEVIQQLINDGLVKVPGGGTAAGTGQLTLSDFSLKPKIIGKYF
ncbi:MAG: hypothetical protein JW915_06230 [Chitinispirillaceae bacterium]|nr:hypothetical protein [Chitinispirillaceae bacterium]